MPNQRLLVVLGTVALLAALVPASALGAFPQAGTFTGLTAAGDPYSMSVRTTPAKKGAKTGKKKKKRRKKRRAMAIVSGITSAVPVTCEFGPPHDEPVSIPVPVRAFVSHYFYSGRIEPLSVGGELKMEVTGHFTTTGSATGWVSYSSTVPGNRCGGFQSWTAVRG